MKTAAVKKLLKTDSVVIKYIGKKSGGKKWRIGPVTNHVKSQTSELVLALLNKFLNVFPTV